MRTSLNHSALAPFGVEVQVDLAKPLTSSDKTQLHSLFARDGLLVCRGLDLSMEEQSEFCRVFGPVKQTPYENFIVSNVDDNGHLGIGGWSDAIDAAQCEC